MITYIKFSDLNTGRSSEIGISESICILEDTILSNTYISAVERCFARDISDYYDKFDLSNGVNYLPFNSCLVRYNNSTISLREGAVRHDGIPSDIHIVRYAGGDSIRSFSWGRGKDMGKSISSRDLTKYDAVLPISSWVRLESLVNKVLGYTFMTLNSNQEIEGGISFNFDSPFRTSRVCLQVIYLILSEIIMNDSNNKVVLLSKIRDLGDKIGNNLVKTLASYATGVIVV